MLSDADADADADTPPIDGDADPDAWSALGELYHRYLTGLLLALVVRHGTARTTEIVFRTFRRQHLELFLPGLTKLGLDRLPHAVACAQYHVLSNALGGVRVEWIPESDTVSWVRYLPPRWIFDGTAVCAIPTEVSRAMLWGWHGHNGTSLGNDRLGFVATMQTTDGQPGLEGYYVEEPHPLDPADRVRFRPGQRPSSDPVALDVPAWNDERLAKVERNYAVAYIRSLLPELCNVLGPADAAAVGSLAGRQIGMQYHQAIMGRIDGPTRSGAGTPATSPGARLGRLLAAHGSRIAVAVADDDRIVIERCDLFSPDLPAEGYEAWTGLWDGLAAMDGLRIVATERRELGDTTTTWRLCPR